MSFQRNRHTRPAPKRGFNIPYVIVPGVGKPSPPVGPVRPNATKRLAMEAEKKKAEEAKKIEKDIDNTNNAGMM